jgi:hypothetical protein
MVRRTLNVFLYLSAVFAHWAFVNFMLLSHAYSYNQYVNQQMDLIKHGSVQVSISYTFQHLHAILRECSRTKEYKSNTHSSERDAVPSSACWTCTALF